MIRLMHLVLRFLARQVARPSASPNFRATLPLPSLSTSVWKEQGGEGTTGVAVAHIGGGRTLSWSGRKESGRLSLQQCHLCQQRYVTWISLNYQAPSKCYARQLEQQCLFCSRGRVGLTQGPVGDHVSLLSRWCAGEFKPP